MRLLLDTHAFLWWVEGAIRTLLLAAIAGSVTALLPPAVAGAAWAVVALSAVTAVVLPPIRHRRWRWAVREDDVWVRQGILWVTTTVVPFSRLQFVDTRQGPLERALGLASLVLHTAAYWLLLSLRSLAPRNSFWRDAQFDTIRLCLIKVAARVTEMVTRIKVALPSAFPYQAAFTDLAGRIVRLPP